MIENKRPFILKWVLAIWICVTVQFISQKFPDVVRVLARSKLTKWTEELSMHLYMTHYMFLVGPFYVHKLPYSKPIQLLFFFVGTVVSALLLRYISEKVLRVSQETAQA